MPNLIFYNPPPFTRWLLVFVGIGVTGLAMSLLPNELFLMCGWIGALWLGVALFVGLIIAVAGRGQVVALRQDQDRLHVKTAGLFNTGRSFDMPVAEATNWRWLTQDGDPRIGPRLVMLAFDRAGRTQRLPLSTAQAYDAAALRALAPKVWDDMVAKYPGLAESRGAGTLRGSTGG